jgi:hypothetical protein
MPYLYDTLLRFGLRPGKDFEFNEQTDSLMRVVGPGVKLLVMRRFWVTRRNLHVTLVPSADGVVRTALVQAADGIRRTGFWQVILDAQGRPVAEHPLTWSPRKLKPAPMPVGKRSDQTPSTQAESLPTIETTGDLCRMMVSWLVAYNRLNDDGIARVLQILSVHALSPREVILEIKTRADAERLMHELTFFAEDAGSIIGASVQAERLSERIARLLKEFPV